MSKASGINYFSKVAGLKSGDFKVFYTFENSGDSYVASVPLGNNKYSGVIASVGDFWTITGSGHLTGQSISISAANELENDEWTKIFVYDKRAVGRATLFSSLQDGSGIKIGITDSNKVFCEGYSSQPVTAIFNETLSDKNVIVVANAFGNISFGSYDFVSSSLAVQDGGQFFPHKPSYNWNLFSGFTGYADYFIYLNKYVHPESLSKMLVGLYAVPTGTGYQVTTQCYDTTTGYQLVDYVTTGITGYLTGAGSDDGVDDFGGLFAGDATVTPLYGVISSGQYQSGVSGTVCQNYTGQITILYKINSGYASSFGKDKINSLRFIDNKDAYKYMVSRYAFDNSYNFLGSDMQSGFLLKANYTNESVNLFVNGVHSSGLIISGNKAYFNSKDSKDLLIYDTKSGQKQIIAVSGQVFEIQYNNNLIYLNGIDLSSGKDFTCASNHVTLINGATGVSGYLVVDVNYLLQQTGNFTNIILNRFNRNSSNIYLNGVREKINTDYIEGTTIDLLSGYNYNNQWVETIYGDDDLYWE